MKKLLLYSVLSLKTNQKILLKASNKYNAIYYSLNFKFCNNNNNNNNNNINNDKDNNNNNIDKKDKKDKKEVEDKHNKKLDKSNNMTNDEINKLINEAKEAAINTIKISESNYESDMKNQAIKSNDIEENNKLIHNESKKVNANEINEHKNSKESSESFESDLTPIIYWHQPILPFCEFSVKNPSRNDLFFGLLLKYGKLKVIDDSTTAIENICLFNEKENFLKSKEYLSDNLIAIKCTALFSKGVLNIKVLNSMYSVKNFKAGKYKFFNINEANIYKLKTPSITFLKENIIKIKSDFNKRIEFLYVYVLLCLSKISSLKTECESLDKSLNLKSEFFGDNDLKFNFTSEDIDNKCLELSVYYKEKLQKIRDENNNNNSNNNKSTSNKNENNANDDIVQEYNLVENDSNLYDDILYNELSETFQSILKFTNYYTLKSNIYNYQIYNSNLDISKLKNYNEISERLTYILETNKTFNLIINLKYNFYKFNKDYKFNLAEPFRNKSNEDLNLINKYKEIIDAKISDVDTIEKEKEAISQKLNNIKNMSDEVKSTVNKELSKISSVNYESENSKRFEYLNHIISLPWDNKDQPVWDIDYAKKVLDDNLYGLEETKQTIYEFIAKNIRTNNQKGCVLMLTGGPGTGKTRIAKLIGEALQRKVGFISLAGISDGKTILGFKRTYISSTPGVLIKEMQKVNTNNPVIVIDEIDKVNVSYGYSNVFNALLQILNPEENSRFRDHYLEIPFDFSNVIFVLTSNSKEIFAPLLDRMEVINVEPYMYFEKFLISKNYALKQIIKEYHMEDQLEITDSAVYYLIKNYCKYEAGVRKLKKILENVVRKVTSKLELDKLDNLYYNKDNKIVINENNVVKIIDELNDEDIILSNMIISRQNSIGTCVGLFVSKSSQLNSWGDASLFSVQIRNKKNKFLNRITKNFYEKSLIENKIHNKDKSKNYNLSKDKKSKTKSKIKSDNKSDNFNLKITSTGNLGEDSIQSLKIALELASEILIDIDEKKYSNYFMDKEIHYDCPQILQPKSGPSAGVVAFICSVSAALNKPIIPNIAMTGEVGLDGSVYKIGGVKEKCQGAQRYGIKTMILPIGNKNDFMELQDNLKNSFERVYFARTVKDVYDVGFNYDTSKIDMYIRNYSNSDENIFIDSENNVLMKENKLI